MIESWVVPFLQFIGADISDAFLLLVIAGLGAYCRSLRHELERSEDRCIERDKSMKSHIGDGLAGLSVRINASEKRYVDSTAELWRKYHDVKESYSRLDTLNYGMAKVVEAKTGIKLINDSADGEGNYTIKR